jgi:hypothetical protein
MRIATTKANRIYCHKRLEGFDETLAMTFDEKLTPRYGLRIGGGRTGILSANTMVSSSFIRIGITNKF